MTYSIVARCPETGDIGVAMQSAFFAVGNRCAWVRAGVGAVATQADTNVSFGPGGLGALQRGDSAVEVVTGLLDNDDMATGRQLAVVAADGSVAARTGTATVAYAGDLRLEQASVQGNWLCGPEVLEEMGATWQAGAGEPLWSRLLDVLDAGQVAGGERRGMQSAVLKIARGHEFQNYWEGLTANVRVDDHPRPLVELRRLATLERAMNHLYDAIEHARSGDGQAVRSSISAARELAPGNEMVDFFVDEISDPSREATSITWPLHQLAKGRQRNPSFDEHAGH